tara:strand:+ start:469 stop:702 length:234 start_codon:yes stop_codon:yes gene_type:complete
MKKFKLLFLLFAFVAVYETEGMEAPMPSNDPVECFTKFQSRIGYSSIKCSTCEPKENAEGIRDEEEETLYCTPEVVE